MTDIQQIEQFLGCATPEAWLQQAAQQQALILIDHAHCEKKAAASALNMLYRYVDKYPLLQKMSRLAREELRHFEKVLRLLEQRGITYCHLSPARYAEGLRQGLRREEPEQLIDKLIIGAIIEARSCERFAKLAPLLDDELATFYRSLLRSEARHYQDYLTLAESYATEDIGDRIDYFLQQETQLIQAPDTELRFHSGPLTS